MLGTRRIMMFLLAVILIIAGMGISARPAQASGCSYYHTVRPGQTLARIARYYGAYWPYLAQINGIRAPRYIIYAGQVPAGGVWFIPPLLIPTPITVTVESQLSGLPALPVIPA